MFVFSSNKIKKVDENQKKSASGKMFAEDDEWPQ